jgi:Holliday junction resolvasome RuvABC DNA-binding subunit
MTSHDGQEMTIEYTESDQTAEDLTGGSRFASSLMEFPVLADSLNYAKNTKYGNIAVNATGAAFNTVSKITSPVQDRLRPQINQVDEFAAYTVKTIGDRVPVIRSPTNDIIEKVKTPLATVTTPVYTIAAGVSGELEQRVAVPAKNLAQSVHAQIHPFAKNVDRSMQPVVDKYATFVDSYLPKGDESNEEGDEVSEFQQTQRALKTTAKAQRRLSQHLKDRFTSTQTFTQEQLRQLHEQSTLLRNVTETLNELNVKLLSIVLSAKQNAATLRDTVQNPDLAVSIHARLHDLVGAILELDKEKDLPKAVKERVIELSHNLVSTTDSIATYIKANAVHFPEHIKQSLAPLISFFNDRYTDLMEEITNKDTSAIEKAKKIAQVTADHVLPILERSLTEVQRSLTFYGTTATTNVNITTTNTVDVTS